MFGQYTELHDCHRQRLQPDLHDADAAERSDALNYNLYLDAARTSIWGDGTGGTALFTVAIPSGKAVNVTIFGRIPAGQDVAAGSYSDSIVVTIQF